jgi:hypothetical protein
MLNDKKTYVGASMLCSLFVVLVSAGCTPKLSPETWISLGTENFDRGHDIANIGVGASRGEFSRLRFELGGGATELRWVLVFLEDGEKLSLVEGGSSDYGVWNAPPAGERIFELPGPRLIKRIEFRVSFIGRDMADVRAGHVNVYGWKPAKSAIE